MATMRAARRTTCTNCGLNTHHFKSCTAPVTSYGIIAFRVNQPDWNQAQQLARDDFELNGLPCNQIEYIMIQRRDSIGFVELLRAKYKVTDIDYIREQIAGITQQEREALLTKPFQELWTGLWGPMTHMENRQYRQEYEQAKIKFEALKQGVSIHGEHGETLVTLQNLIDTTPLLWNTPEWGFPKGRRNAFESDYACAVREFCEETGLQANDIVVYDNIEPIRETFFGNNNIHYCHVYYIAWVRNSAALGLQQGNPHMNREIGNIGWFSVDEALKTIRSVNMEKRDVLLRASSILRSVCPMLVGPVSEVGGNPPAESSSKTNL